MLSQVISLKVLKNARDLGGMVNIHGKKVKPCRLIRSASLCEQYCDIEDVQKLKDKYHLKKIIDLRNLNEMIESPDIVLDDIKYYQYQVMGYVDFAIQHDKKSEEEKENFMTRYKSPQAAKENMMNSYRQFAINPISLNAYSNFVNKLLENQEGSCLWHCAMGKDRAGIASVIVEALLDIDIETIHQDYLLTNKCFHDDKLPQETCEDYFTYAFDDYFDMFMNTVKETYGSLEDYIRIGLGISDEQKRQFQKMYLE